MKEITDNYSIKAKNKLKVNTAYFLGEGPSIIVNEKKIDVPKSIILCTEAITRLFEVENIEDLIENYEQLSLPVEIPKPIKEWQDKIRGDLMGYYAAISFEESVEYAGLVSLPGSHQGMNNYNLVMLNNVYLRSPQRIGGRHYRACDFEVVDIHGDSIQGALVYRHIPPLSRDDTLEEQLIIAENSSPLTTFNLTVNVLVKGFMPFFIGKKFIGERGERLLIQNIDKPKGKRGDVPTSIYSPSAEEPVAVR